MPCYYPLFGLRLFRRSTVCSQISWAPSNESFRKSDKSGTAQSGRERSTSTNKHGAASRFRKSLAPVSDSLLFGLIHGMRQSNTNPSWPTAIEYLNVRH